MGFWNLLTDKRRVPPAPHATLQEHPFLSLVAYIAESFAPSGRYIPFRETQWHPIYSNRRLSTEARRAMREAELPNEWTAEVWNEARRFWNGQCAACGRRTDKLERDHIIPIADVRCPGATVENLIPLCKSCNTDKSANDLARWHMENFGDRRRTNELLDKVAEWQDYASQRFPSEDRHLLRVVAKPQYAAFKKKMRRPKRSRKNRRRK